VAGDPFRKVTSGEEVKLTAEWWNAVTDAAQIVAQNKANVLASRLAPRPLQWGEVFAKAGSDLAAFTAVNVFSPVLPIDSSNTDKLNHFKFNEIIYSIGTFTRSQELAFGITQEPIKAGRIGIVRIAGRSPALINISSSSYVGWARPQPSTPTKLKAGSFGSVKILALESTSTGDRWGIVEMRNKKDDVTAELAASLSSGGTSANAVVKIGSTSTGETVTVFDQDTWIGATALNSPTRVLGRYDFEADQLILKNWKCPT
jgi:hypothetical protein